MNTIQLFEVFGTIALRDDGFTKGIRNATDEGESFGTKFGNVMSSIGKAVVVGTGAAITAFGALSIKALQAGGDLEQSIGGIETLFKDSAATVIKNAEIAYRTAGVNAVDYMNQVTSFSASLLQSLDGDTVAAAKSADMAVIDMADNANKMGTAVELIQNAYQGFAKQNYMMLDNLKLGYGGTKTEMERLLADAEKISGIKYDISNLNDVYQAIHVIQGELGITGTTAKEGMETLNGAFGTAKAALGNFLSGAGGVDAVVDSLSNLGDVAADRLGVLLPRLATGLKEIFKGLLGKIGETVPALRPLTNSIAFLTENFDKFLMVAIPVIAAIAGYNAVNTIAAILVNAHAASELAATGVLTAKTVIVGLLTGSISLATAAQWLWNIALNANPVGLLVAGVAALAAGIAILIGWLNKQNSTTKKLNEENKKLKDSTNALNDSIDSSKKAYDDNLSSIDAQIGATQKLSDEVFALAEQENKSAEDKQRLAAMVEVLNGSMEELNVQYDAENDSLTQTKESINAVIEARLEQAKATAAQERAVEIAREQMIVEEQLNKIHDQREAWNVAYEEGEVKSRAYNKALEDLATQEGDLNTQNADLAISFDYVAGVIADSLNSTTTAMENQAAVMQAKTEAQATALKNLSDEYTTYSDAATNMFDTISDKSKISFDEMLKNLQENQRVVGEWATNIETLSKRGIDTGLLSQLKRMGPEGAGYVAELVKQSDSKLADLNKAFESGGKTSVTALTKVWGIDTTVAQAAADLATDSATALEQGLVDADFAGMGSNVADGLAQGINDNIWVAVAAAQSMAAQVAAAAQTKLGIKSPSKVFSWIGKMTGEGYVEGVKSMYSKVKDSVENMFSLTNDNGLSVGASVNATSGSSTPTGGNTFITQNISAPVQSASEFAEYTKAIFDRRTWTM